MKEPRAIRYFYDEYKARKACELVKREGFECEVVEDTFNKVSLDRFGMRRRYKIVIERNEVFKIAERLGKKLKK